MSYILEALKKAQAERGQGQVPGLHDQHMTPEFSGGSARESNALLVWIIMGMGVVMMGLLVWALWQPDAVAVPPAPATAALPAPMPAPSPAPAQATYEPALQPRHEPRPRNEPIKADPRPALAANATEAPLPELPESMRAQLPKLNFGGAMHSDQPASRMLIVNGQLLHEGDALSPDLTLERIALKQATFRFKGYRYTVQY